MASSDPALLHHFTVALDDVDIGTFTELSGLSVTTGFTTITEGGQNDYQQPLWGSITYGKVTLVRAINANSAAIAAWVSSFASPSASPSTARIEALDGTGAPIVAWILTGVVPSSWTGPAWSAAAVGVAKETLVLMHCGFSLDSSPADRPPVGASTSGAS